MMHMMNNMGVHGFSMFYWMLLQWGLLLGGIYLFIRWINGGKKEDPALQILRERFAKGEITEEEYRDKRNELLR
ncbi:hypothetical protein BEP19_00630 [Ammoniphilus oxalaticus]|uniref:SHOCT domain-containing protein n=1 Tax=Ammoniphilus oxalaticus TaxID=66863 RepID=A0A419SRR7_9BACL|nr:SHOCT domain-containing protein [Ammoniphilus oxalaticus]RKD27111.1 hypothetical protein BEP19_00630 [Ammoniphilus oxalaticus]